MSTVSTRAGRWSSILARVAPGLPALLSYRGADLPRDLVAGLSVACVALPVGVAYAALAGFSPEVGLYSSILPLVAYALFGTSRQNGIALSIALGQLGKLFGFPIDAGGIIPRLLEFIGKLGLTHGPTLAVGLASFAVLLVAPRVVPRVPAVVTMIDVSGLYMARDFIDILSARGVTFGMAGRQTEWSQWNERHKLEKFKDVRSFPTVGAAIKAYGEETGIIAETAEDE